MGRPGAADRSPTPEEPAPLDLWKTVSTGLGLCVRHAGPLALVALVWFGGPLLSTSIAAHRTWDAWHAGPGRRLPDPDVKPGLWLWMCVLAVPFLQAVLTPALLRDLGGRPARFRHALGQGPRHALGFFLGIFALLALLFVFVGGMVVGATGPDLSVGEPWATLRILTLGTLGLWILSIHLVAIPCRVAEPGPLTATLRRSAELTRGRRFQTFALALLLVGPPWLLDVGLRRVLPEPTAPFWAWFAGLFARRTLVGGWLLAGSACAVAAYRDLRRLRGELTAEEVQRIFG